MNWYYALNGQQQGPVSEQDIVRLVASGTLAASTLIWRDGLPDWQPISTALPAALGTAAPASAPQIGGIAVPEAQKDLYVQQLREGVIPSAPGSMEYAGFWIRFGAKFIDGLIFGLGLVVLIGLIGVALHFSGLTVIPPDTADRNAPPPVGMIILMVIYYLAAFLGRPAYNAILVAKYESTPGKMACGLKVVNDNGSRVSTGKAWGRGFAELLSGMTCSIGYIIAGFDDQKRSLHDHVCSTRVIRVR